MQFSKIEPPNRRKSLESTRRLVGVPGVEPGTSSLSGTRYNQLSYTPLNQETRCWLVEATGIEPVTSCLQSTRSTN